MAKASRLGRSEPHQWSTTQQPTGPFKVPSTPFKLVSHNNQGYNNLLCHKVRSNTGLSCLCLSFPPITILCHNQSTIVRSHNNYNNNQMLTSTIPIILQSTIRLSSTANKLQGYNVCSITMAVWALSRLVSGIVLSVQGPWQLGIRPPIAVR